MPEETNQSAPPGGGAGEAPAAWRQRPAVVTTIALVLLAGATSGALIPATLLQAWPLRLAAGLAAVAAGTALVRAGYQGATWVLPRAARLAHRASQWALTAATSIRQDLPPATPWLASALGVTLGAGAYVASQVLPAFDAVREPAVPWLSLLLGAGLAAACLLVAVAAAWVMGFPRWRRLAVGGAALVGALLGGWLLWSASRPAPAALPPSDVARALDDPALPGPYEVEVLTYGPADDPRPEYGARARLRTGRADLSAVTPGGWTDARTARLGFGPRSLPLVGRLYLPKGPGPFPLVLVAHGAADLTLPSERGFEQLGRLLASRGSAVAAMDHAFLGYGWSDGGNLDGDDVVMRAWLTVAHGAAFVDWNEEVGGALQGRLDLSRVALVGHSRGGEAAALAVRCLAEGPSTGGLQVRAVAALAPSSNQPTPTLDVSYLTLHGDLDNDVEAFTGLRTFELARPVRAPAGSGLPLKAAIYVEGANHAQFNEAWGTRDLPWPYGLLEGRDQALSPAAQRRVTAVYLSAFLDATLRGDSGARALLRDGRRAAALLPGVHATSRYVDAGARLLAGFDDDDDARLATVPGAEVAIGGALAEEVSPPLRLVGDFGSLQRHALRLAWSGTPGGRAPSVEVRLRKGGASLSGRALSLAVAFPAAAVPILVELRDGAGRTATGALEAAFPVRPLRRAHLTRLGLAEQAERELAFQTALVEPRELRAVQPGFDPGDVRQVRLELGGAAGELYLDDLAIQPVDGPPAPAAR